MNEWLGADERADWHTHSDRTDGVDSAEAMADAAVRAGLKVWGLSDHVRAATTWVPEYVEATRLIRRDGLEIHCGVEAKLLTTAGRLDLPSTLPDLDYVLVADHQFPARDGPQHPATIRAAIGNGSLPAADVVSDLVAATAAGIRRSPFRPIVAHLFSLLPKLGLSEEDVTLEHLDSLASACLDTGGSVEANEKWRCPSADTLDYVASLGVTITTGSDAHRVEDVGRRDYLDLVRAELRTTSRPRRSDRQTLDATAR